MGKRKHTEEIKKEDEDPIIFVKEEVEDDAPRKKKSKRKSKLAEDEKAVETVALEEDEDVKPGEDEKPPKMVKREEEAPKESALKKKFQGIPFSKAMKLVKKDPTGGLKIVNERRHVSLPYHAMCRDSIKKALDYICQNQIYKYRSAVGGAIVSVDFEKIKIISLPRVIDDQTCFHFTAVTPLAVFSPKKDQIFEAMITSMSTSFLTALIYNAVTANVDFDQKVQKTLKGTKLEEGDIIKIACQSLQIKRGMCQMKATFKSFIRKGTTEEKDLLASLETYEEQQPKTEYSRPSKSARKSMKFADDEE